MGYGNSIRVLYPISPVRSEDSILKEYENIGLGLGTSVVPNLVRKLPVMQNLQLSHCHGQLFDKPSFAEVLERNGSCCNRNGESKPNGKCSIARYGKNEEREASSDVVTDVFSNITAVRWIDNKVVNAISTFTGKQPIQQPNVIAIVKNEE